MNSNHLDRQPQPTISDEMLSAYLDGEVTPQERLQIERAAAQDSDTAWRLASLQQTVALVKALPRVTLPRSFTLSEADVAPPRAAAPASAPWWRALFDPILLRNATAMTAVLFLVLLVGDLAPRLISPAAAPTARLFKETVVVEEYTTPTQPAVMAQALAPQPTPTWEGTPAAAVGAPAPTLGETREATIPMPTPTSGITPAAAMLMPTTTPSAGLSSPGSSGEAEATPPLPEAPPAAASGPLVTTVPAVTAPALELVAPVSAPTEAAAKAAAPQTNAAIPGPNWLRIGQVLLALLTGGLFVAWRRALSPTR
jgi:hypothetical protein